MMKKTAKYTVVLCALMIALCVLVPALAVSESAEEKTDAIREAQASFADLYEAINPSVVYISVAKAADENETGGDYNFDFGWGDIFGPEMERFFEQFQDLIPQEEKDDTQVSPDEEVEGEVESAPNYTYGSGTGFVWDNEGHIVTNNHVIEGATEISVTYSDGLVRDAVLIGADPDSDLAVIYVEDYKEDIAPVVMGDSTQLRPGDLVAAIGNPLGQTGTMTQGIVSALHRSFTVDNGDENGNYTIPDMIQTDASINPGNSGGVLINMDGEVIGVVNSFSSYSYSSAGIGYAIPGNLAKRVVPALIADGQYRHPWIGISGIALTPAINEALELPHDQRGAYIQTLQSGSPAEEAGLIAGNEELTLKSGGVIKVGGDIITQIGNRQVFAMDDIIAYLSSETSVGDTIELQVIRDNGDEETVELTLKARPTAAERAAAQETAEEEVAEVQEQGRAYMGVTINELNTDILDLMDLPEDTAGVLILDVDYDSPAEDAGLLGCDEEATVDGKSVEYGGDIIIAIDGKAVSNVEELKNEISAHLPGERITVTLIRDGEETEQRMYLGNSNAR